MDLFNMKIHMSQIGYYDNLTVFSKKLLWFFIYAYFTIHFEIPH